VRTLYHHIKAIFAKRAGDDKVIEPLYNTIAHLLTKNCFIKDEFLEEADLIHKAVLKENSDPKNIHKILASVDIYFNLLFFTKEDKFNIYKRAMKSLLMLMTHKYPVVRKKTSEKLFIYVASMDDPSQYGLEFDDVDTITVLISDTNWTEPITDIRDNRNTIAGLLKIDLQVAKT
jgi:hypothetical protein